MEYNQVIEYLDNNSNIEDNDQMQLFKSILDHRRGPRGRVEVLVSWEDGDETLEPLSAIVRKLNSLPNELDPTYQCQ